MKSVLWPTLISNVVNASLSGGSLGYWTACNNFKRYCTRPTVILKPCVWTHFDAVVVYCSFLIPRSDGHRLTTLNVICLYITYIYIISRLCMFSNTRPSINCQNVELRFMPGVSWQQWAIPTVTSNHLPHPHRESPWGDEKLSDTLIDSHLGLRRYQSRKNDHI